MLVHGNCQAESLRIVLGEPLESVRIPPVHELVAADLPHLGRWLRWADVLVCQPIRAGYRGLPIGTADVLAAAGPRAQLVLFPVIRDASLYPDQAIVRPCGDPGAVPPLVPYHSLRLLAEAGGLAPRRRWRLTPAAVKSVARHSLGELRRREREHRTLVVSDRLAHPSFALMRTVNHPGNPLLRALAERVHAAVGLDAAPADPGRPLLASVHGPREPAVIEAFGLPDAPEREWSVEDRRVPADALRTAHLAWYAERPQTVAAGLRRHALALRALGLT